MYNIRRTEREKRILTVNDTKLFRQRGECQVKEEDETALPLSTTNRRQLHTFLPSTEDFLQV